MRMVFCAVKNHHLIEAAGMKIAPLEVAKYFAHETMIPEIEGINTLCVPQMGGDRTRSIRSFRADSRLVV